MAQAVGWAAPCARQVLLLTPHKQAESTTTQVGSALAEARAAWDGELHAAVAAERERVRAQYTAQLEDGERASLEERRKLTAELAAEREQGRAALKKERAAIEEELRSLRTMDERTNAALRADLEGSMAELSRRHEVELRELRAQLAVEKESWEDMYMRKHAATLKSKEAAMRDELRVERDRQINMVIERLTGEMTQAQADLDAQLETRVSRIKERFEAQLRDSEQSEQAAIAKYNDARRRLAAAEEEGASVKGRLEQREADLAALQAAHDKLHRERDRVTDVVRMDFADTLAANEAEIAQLRAAQADAAAGHRREFTALQSDKEEELRKLHERVQQAISKKDETIETLRRQHDAAALRADHLEELLASQRRDILGKK